MAIMDGKALSETVLKSLKRTIKNKKLKPKLAAVLVGDDAESLLYIERKKAAAAELGIVFDLVHMKPSKKELIVKTIDGLNKDPSVHGILVQLPIPGIEDPTEVLSHICPLKDVDGLATSNVASMWTRNGTEDYDKAPYFLPCTALAVQAILDKHKVDVKGKHVVVVGRSNGVGKPIAALMLARDAAVTIVHDQIKELMDYTLKADVLIVATGVKHLMKANMVPVGSIVVDVGITRSGKNVHGDVDPSVQKKVKLFSPVPGGVGPMTVAMLMSNVVKAAQHKASK